MAKLARRAFVALLLLVAIGIVAPAASADPPVTETITGKATETFEDVIPFCDEDGALYEITIDYNFIEHVTAFDDGRVHVTFTSTGAFVAVPLEAGSLPASGRFTQWGGFNDNGGAVNGTFTFSVRGQYSDGTRINFHFTDHFNETPSGASFAFSHCHD